MEWAGRRSFVRSGPQSHSFFAPDTVAPLSLSNDTTQRLPQRSAMSDASSSSSPSIHACPNLFCPPPPSYIPSPASVPPIGRPPSFLMALGGRLLNVLLPLLHRPGTDRGVGTLLGNESAQLPETDKSASLPRLRSAPQQSTHAHERWGERGEKLSERTRGLKRGKRGGEA